MMDGGDRIMSMDWNAVGSIMQRGGTIIGAARLSARERATCRPLLEGREPGAE